MNNNKKAFKQLNIMLLITIIIQFFTLIKNAIVASYFGVGAELDAFNLSNRISTFVYSFIGAGISTVIIPYLKDKINKKSINIFISIVYTVGFLLLLMMILFREQIVTIIGGYDDQTYINMASNIFIFTIISGFLNSIIQLIKAIMEFNGQFNRQKLAVLFTTTLFVLLLWFGNANIYFYSLVLLLTTIIGIFIHIYFLRKCSFNFNLNYDLRDNGFKEMLKLFIPTIMSTGVYQISMLIDTVIAARLDVGSISILNYSNSIISMINLLLLGNITSFVYPRLVKKSNENSRQNSLTDYILLINAIMCIIIIIFSLVGKDAVSILFERGKFTSDNTTLVYVCTLIFSFSLPTNGIRDLLYRYFYVNKDTYTPFINSIMISIVNIIISIVLSYFIGLYGVVIGTVIASYLSLLFISIKFKKKFAILFSGRKFIIENLKIIFITIISILIMLGMDNLLFINNSFIKIIAYSVIALIIFTVLLKLLNSKVFKINL